MSRICGSESWVGCQYVQVSPGSTPCIGCLAMSVSLCWWVGVSRTLWDERICMRRPSLAYSISILEVGNVVT